MKFTAVFALGLAAAAGVNADAGSAMKAMLSSLSGQCGDPANATFPDLSKAQGLSSSAMSLAKKCQDTAKKIPSCGYQCLEDSAKSVNCSFWDFECQCKGNNPATIRSAAIGCVICNCPLPTALELQQNAENVCGCAGMAVPTLSTTSI